MSRFSCAILLFAVNARAQDVPAAALDKTPPAPCPTDPFAVWAILLAAVYLASVLLVRWYNIAVPNRNLLRARAQDVRIRATAAGFDCAPLDSIIHPSPTLLRRVSDFFFWSEGEENASFATLHYFELRLLDVPGMPPDKVTARLATARQQLAISEDTLGKAFSARIDESFKCSPSSSPEQLRELLIEVQYYLYNLRDTGYLSLTAWQNKAVWLTIVGLILIVFLGFALLPQYILFVVGAAGGFLSRLMKQLKRANVPTDYGASWTTLFLSPVLGALTGWFGVLMISFANQPGFDLVGGPFKLVQWARPCAPGTLFGAFLLGFAERLFDGIIKRLEDQIDRHDEDMKKAPQAPAALPASSSADPKLSRETPPGPTSLAIEPTSGPPGTPVVLTLKTIHAEAVERVAMTGGAGNAVAVDAFEKAQSTLAFRIPAAPLGIYDLRLTVAGRDLPDTARFEVTAS